MMDPNACLARIQELLRDLGVVGDDDPALAEELASAMDDLRVWIANGGFEPDWSMHLEAAGAFRFWLLTEWD